MRKLTKKSLDELAKVMPVLSEREQRIYIGGDTLTKHYGIPVYGVGDNPFIPVNPFSSAVGGIHTYSAASASVPEDNGSGGSGNFGYFGSGDFGSGFYEDDFFVDGSGNRYKGYFDEDGNWVFLDDKERPNSGAVSDSTDVDGSGFWDEDSDHQPVTEDGDTTTDDTTGKDKTLFTLEEFINLYEQQLWPGGYVEGVGYIEGNSTDNVLDTVEVTGKQGGGSSGGNNGGGNSTPNDSIIHIPNPPIDQSNPDDGTKDENINVPNKPVIDPHLTNIPDVIPVSAFAPYQDATGCQKRCKKMLEAAGVQMSGKRIHMTANNNGSAGETLPTAKEALECINTTLEQGKPIIVGVDYKPDGINPGAEDHFIVITGRKVTVDPQTGNTIVQYHYFDPNTSDNVRGTQASNLLTLVNN